MREACRLMIMCVYCAHDSFDSKVTDVEVLKYVCIWSNVVNRNYIFIRLGSEGYRSAAHWEAG